MKKILYLIIVILVLVLGIYVANICGFSLFGTLFPNEGPKIEKTANVVTEVKAISKFTTACFYEELPLSTSKTSAAVDNSVVGTVAGWFGKRPKDVMSDNLCVIVSGKVRAGYDLSQLTEDHLRQSNDTIWVTLPPVEIFDAVVNPSDVDVFVEDGTWSHQEMTRLTASATDQLIADATAAGILERARTSGEDQLRALFQSFGFTTVILE